jgi:trimethylguanosine synthase
MSENFTTVESHTKGISIITVLGSSVHVRTSIFRGVKCPEIPLAPEGVAQKSWFKRFNLFSKFDDGINMDSDAWFDTTPEVVSRHVANYLIRQCKSTTVVDACCGVGSVCIQVACIASKMNKTVEIVAFDISESRLELSKHNANVYSVNNMIKFIHNDFCNSQIDCPWNTTAVFLSPPWGGPSCNDLSSFSIFDHEPLIADMARHAIRSVGREVVLFLPKHTRIEEIVTLSRELKCKLKMIETVVYILPVPHVKGILVYLSAPKKL